MYQALFVGICFAVISVVSYYVGKQMGLIQMARYVRNRLYVRHDPYVVCRECHEQSVLRELEDGQPTRHYSSCTIGRLGL